MRTKKDLTRIILFNLLSGKERQNLAANNFFPHFYSVSLHLLFTKFCGVFPVINFALLDGAQRH